MRGNWGSERLRGLPKVTQLESYATGSKTQGSIEANVGTKASRQCWALMCSSKQSRIYFSEYIWILPDRKIQRIKQTNKQFRMQGLVGVGRRIPAGKPLPLSRQKDESIQWDIFSCNSNSLMYPKLKFHRTAFPSRIGVRKNHGLWGGHLFL